MTSGNARALRHIMALAHGWSGFVSGLFVLLIGVTGAALAFFGELFELQYGDMLRAPEAPYADIGEIIQAAEDGHPGEFQTLGMFMPDTRVEGLETALVYGFVPEVQGDVMMASVDAGTATYQGSFQLGKAFAHEFNDFHFSLLMGGWAQTFLAVIGVLIIVFALTGIYLWWPSQGRVLDKATRLQRRGRLSSLFFNWHGLSGIWLALFAMFFALTGTALSKSDWFGPLLGQVDDPAEWEARFQTDCGDNVTPSEAGRAALAAFPGRSISSLIIVNDEQQKYILQLKGPGDIDGRFGDATAHVHATCAGQIWTTTLGDEDVPTKLGGQMLSLHGGHVFGPFAEFFTVLTGLALAFLSGTGIYLFFTRTLPLQRSRRLNGLPRRADASI